MVKEFIQTLHLSGFQLVEKVHYPAHTTIALYKSLAWALTIHLRFSRLVLLSQPIKRRQKYYFNSGLWFRCLKCANFALEFSLTCFRFRGVNTSRSYLELVVYLTLSSFFLKFITYYYFIVNRAIIFKSLEFWNVHKNTTTCAKLVVKKK